MGETTEISWCDSTWNPFRGCEKVSPGCKNCYITTTMPFRTSGQKHGDPAVYASEHTWNEPFRWNKKPWICNTCGAAHAIQLCEDCMIHGGHHRRRVFTPSLSDWLWDKIAVDRLVRFLDTIRQCHDIDFLLLTKRPELFPERMQRSLWSTVAGDPAKWLCDWIDGNPPKNVWIGTSIEDQTNADKRIPELLKIPARVRFLSVEPLLGPVDLVGKRNWLAQDTDEPNVHWVIVGGESGTSARPCNVEWIQSIKDQCKASGTACFVKQDSGPRSGMQGRLPDELFNTKEFPSI